MDNQNHKLGSPTFQSLPAPKMNPAPAQVKKRRCNEVVSKSSNSKTEPCASPCNELSIILYLKLICFHTTSKIDFTWLLEKGAGKSLIAHAHYLQVTFMSIFGEIWPTLVNLFIQYCIFLLAGETHHFRRS